MQMSNMIYIQDDFGSQIPMLDRHGNLTTQVLMLYTEDKLTEEDRKTINDFVASDEMAKDALEGFSLSSNPSKTRYHLGELNHAIQKASGAKASAFVKATSSSYDYKKLAAGVAALLIIGAATFWGTTYFNQRELAHQTTTEQPPFTPPQPKASGVSELTEDDAPDTTTVATRPNLARTPALPEPAKEAEPKAIERSTPKKNDSAIEDQSNADKRLVKPAQQKSTMQNQAEAPKQQDEVVANNDLEAAETTAAGVTEKPENDTEQAVEETAESMPSEALSLTTTSSKPSQQATEKTSISESEEDEKELNATNNTVTPIASQHPTKASYPGGAIAMYKFIEQKKIYTEAMRASEIRGAVTIEFTVDTEGRITQAKVKSGGHGLMNEDALRVIRSMPRWKPATNAAGETIETKQSAVVIYGD